jgi:hypothetical protein
MSGLFYHDTVFVLRPATKTNRAQETVLDYAGLELADGYPRALVQVRPTSQVEVSQVDRETALSQWRLATEPFSGDWDVVSTDWLRLPDGTIVRVLGDVAKPSDPQSGRLHHVELTVERAHR